MNQIEIAKRLNATQGEISALFTGRRWPSMTWAKRLEPVVGEPWNVILGWSPEKLEERVTKALTT